MILDETANKHWFMKYWGAFSIIKNAYKRCKPVHTGRLLPDPENRELNYAQVKIDSNLINLITFNKELKVVFGHAEWLLKGYFWQPLGRI